MTAKTAASSNPGPLKIEEYKFCKQQIMENIKIMNQIEIYVIGAIAAVYVFAIAQRDIAVATSAVAIASLIALLGAVRVRALDQTIRVLNDYVQKIEKNELDIGWTSFYRQKRSRYMNWSRIVLWVSLVLLTIGCAIFVMVFGPFWIKPIPK